MPSDDARFSLRIDTQNSGYLFRRPNDLDFKFLPCRIMTLALYVSFPCVRRSQASVLRQLKL